MPSEAIRYINNLPAFDYGGNVDAELLKCASCDAVYHVHFSNSEYLRLADRRYLAGVRINAQHPDHGRSILL